LLIEGTIASSMFVTYYWNISAKLRFCGSPLQKLYRPSVEEVMMPPAVIVITRKIIQIGVMSRPNITESTLFGIHPEAQPQIAPRIVTPAITTHPTKRLLEYSESFPSDWKNLSL